MSSNAQESPNDISSFVNPSVTSLQSTVLGGGNFHPTVYGVFTQRFRELLRSIFVCGGGIPVTDIL